MFKTSLLLASAILSTGLAQAEVKEDESVRRERFKETTARLHDKLGSPERLAQNYSELIKIGLETGTEKVDSPDSTRDESLLHLMWGGPLTRGGLTLLYLADALRVQYNQPGVSGLANDFEQKLLSVVNGKQETGTIKRGQAMGLYCRAYQNADPFVKSSRDKKPFMATASQFSLDADMYVRYAVLETQIVLSAQGNRIVIDRNALKKLEPANEQWQRLLDGTEDDWFPYNCPDCYVEEQRFEMMKRSDDETLLAMVVGPKKGEAQYAVKVLTHDWDRATRCFARLLVCGARSPAIEDIVYALAKPVPLTATEREKKNLDALVLYLGGTNTGLKKGMAGGAYGLGNIDAQIRLLDYGSTGTARTLYGVDAILQHVAVFILSDDAPTAQITRALNRVAGLDPMGRSFLKLMGDSVLALQKKLEGKSVVGDSRDLAVLRETVKESVAMLNDQNVRR